MFGWFRIRPGSWRVFLSAVLRFDRVTVGGGLWVCCSSTSRRMARSLFVLDSGRTGDLVLGIVETAMGQGFTGIGDVDQTGGILGDADIIAHKARGGALGKVPVHFAHNLYYGKYWISV